MMSHSRLDVMAKRPQPDPESPHARDRRGRARPGDRPDGDGRGRARFEGRRGADPQGPARLEGYGAGEDAHAIRTELAAEVRKRAPTVKLTPMGSRTPIRTPTDSRWRTVIQTH